MNEYQGPEISNVYSLDDKRDEKAAEEREKRFDILVDQIIFEYKKLETTESEKDFLEDLQRLIEQDSESEDLDVKGDRNARIRARNLILSGDI